MTERLQLCTFHVAGHYCGIDVHGVQEVLRQQPLTRVPLAPAVVCGLMNLRGQIVTALDLRRRLELPDRPAEGVPVNVVVHTDDGPVSLVVDDIGDVLEVAPADFEPPPKTLQGAARALIRGAYKLPAGLLLVLDTERTVNLAS